MARPTKLTPELADQIVFWIEHGSRPHRAAQACGIAEATFSEWMRRGEDRDADRPADPLFIEFAARVRDAEPKMEAAIVALAIDKIKTTADAILFLERRLPDTYKRREERTANVRVKVDEIAESEGLDAAEVWAEVEAALADR